MRSRGSCSWGSSVRLLRSLCAVALAAAARPALAGDPPPDQFVTQGPSQGFDQWKRMGWNMAILHRLAGQDAGDNAYEQAVQKELDRLVANDPRFAWLKDPSPETRQKAQAALQGRRTDSSAWTKDEVDRVLAQQKQAIDSMYADWRSARSAPPADAPAGAPTKDAPSPANAPADSPPPIPDGSLQAADRSYAADPRSGRGGAGPNSGSEPPSSPAAPSLGKSKSFAALKDPGAFGPAREDGLPDPKDGSRRPDGAPRGPEKGGPAARGGVPAAGAPGAGPGFAAPGIGAAVPRPSLAAGPGFGPPAGGVPPRAPGARDDAGRSVGAPGAAPRAASPPAGGGTPALGSPPVPGARAPAEKAPAAKDAKPAASAGAGELTEEEKKQLSQIQQLLKEAAANGSLDAGALAGAADQLPEGSLALQGIKDRIRDIVSMAGGELSMAQRQEVYELAAKLGLDEAQAKALVRSLERAEPPSPGLERRRRSRAESWWLWLARAALSWWRRLLALLGI